MIERFRYLPCWLADELSCPEWVDVAEPNIRANAPVGYPFILYYLGPKGPDEDIDEEDVESGRCGDHIDLAHPAGWDHAVRAYVAICGVTVPESACCRFVWIDAAEGWEVDIEYGFYSVPGRMVSLTNPNSWSTPAGRREALCRAICAALSLDVNDVFPVTTS